MASLSAGRRGIAGCVLAAMVLLAGGCASRSRVILTSTTKPETFWQEFNRAYITRTSEGEYDVVMVDDGISGTRSGKGPVMPAAQSPLRQVMQIHLYWQPVAGNTTNNPAADNAVIRWYVLPVDAERGHELLVYEGAGLVTMRRKGDLMRVNIRSGNLQPTIRRGDLADPIGSSRITGQVRATRNDTRVQEILADVRQQTAGAPTTAPATSASASRDANP